MRPVLQLDQTLNVQVAALLVFAEVDPDAGRLQDVDAGEPRLGLDGEDAPD